MPSEVIIDRVRYPSGGPPALLNGCVIIFGEPGVSTVRDRLEGLARLAFDAACAHVRMAIKLLDLSEGPEDRPEVERLVNEIRKQEGRAIIWHLYAPLTEASSGCVQVGDVAAANGHAAAFVGSLQLATERWHHLPPSARREDFDRLLVLLQSEALRAAGRPAGPSPVRIDQPPGDTTHSADFRSVLWFGTPYPFTAAQAACVKSLWGAWANGTPDLGQDTILAEAELDAKRLVDLFKGHAAWGAMIVQGSTKGAFRLAGGA
jgi:hypothetical protein